MLPKENRLTGERNFKRVYQKGGKLVGSFFNLKYLANRGSSSRFGIVISVKVSKSAVVRNKLKRQIRAAMMEFMRTAATKNHDDVVVNVFRLPNKNENPQQEIILCLKKLCSN